jgi:hypothetical protein
VFGGDVILNISSFIMFLSAVISMFQIARPVCSKKGVTPQTHWINFSSITGLIPQLPSERWRCQYWCAYVTAAITWLRKEGHKVCETHSETFNKKFWGFFVCNCAGCVHFCSCWATGTRVHVKYSYFPNFCSDQFTEKVKGKGHPCTGTEALYRPYGT